MERLQHLATVDDAHHLGDRDDVDAQVLGPFSRWEHRHRFLEGPEDDRPAARAGTWVEDRVTSRLPGGALGSALHALGAERRILAAFAHRERRLRVLLG